MNVPRRYLADSVELEKCIAENYWQVQEQDIVCIPSLTFKPEEVGKLTGSIHYEERQLFNILLLKNPLTRLIYVTSVPLDPFIVKYYLSLLPAHVPRDDLDQRLILLSTNDLSSRSLAEKVLERPHLLARIKGLLRPNRGLLLTFTSTDLECRLAKELGIPIFGNDTPDLGYWGSKGGGREIFTEAGIPHARGVDISHSDTELARRIAEFLNSTPSVKKLVVKLNYGFGGQGNAMLDVSHLPPGQATEAQVLEALQNMKFSCAKEVWTNFKTRIEQMGVIAEEFLEGEDPKSPSVQGCISMSGDVEILSTHEQVLNGQIYQGCMFPASDSYRALLQRYGRRVGRTLASKGVRGHFGVDFLVTTKPPKDEQVSEKQEKENQKESTQNEMLEKEKQEGEPKKASDGHYVYALEINLRVCGTTHPYFTMKFLTDASYDKRTGLCYSSKGTLKYYTSSDCLHKEQYKGLLPQDVLEGFAKKNLIFDSESQSGIAFHLLGSLSEHGKVGITCVADTAEAATSLFVQVQKVLEELGSNPRLGAKEPIMPRKEMLALRRTAQGETIQVPTREFLTYRNAAMKVGDKDHHAKKLLITVAVHGDEVCGVHAVNELISEGFFDETKNFEGISLAIILGNPLAYLRRQRYVDQNLNRTMLPHLFERGGYESYRAKKICQAITDSDVFLDIHSTSADTPPMALPAENDKSNAFASTFPVDYVIMNLIKAVETRGTTVDWAFFHRKLALSVECGKHESSASVATAKACIKHFIATNRKTCAPHAHANPRVLTCVTAEKVRPGFEYLRDVKAFDFVKRGDVIAKDDEVGDIKCEADHGAYVVMPTKKPYVGEEAFYWAVPAVLNPLN
eukprot:Phypoly_transcript_02631.p1 GENE.Phypoly_transcript_02631~~Phypoly_transcript_02631.p1  ORF type:complete len:853 (+),score=145.66 Phypoly_transcript_02631:90-2648(+)